MQLGIYMYTAGLAQLIENVASSSLHSAALVIRAFIVQRGLNEFHFLIARRASRQAAPYFLAGRLYVYTAADAATDRAGSCLF